MDVIEKLLQLTAWFIGILVGISTLHKNWKEAQKEKEAQKKRPAKKKKGRKK